MRKKYKLKLNIETNPDFINYPPFMPFDVKKEQDFEPLKPIDRIRLVDSMIREHININSLIQNKIAAAYYPLHNKEELEALKSELLLPPSLITRLPIDKIRNYFGEKMAFYFAWLQFYTNSMLIPSILGVCLWGIERYAPASRMHDFAELIFSVFLALWGTWFLTYWQRKEKFLAVKWGTTNILEVQDNRPEYEGVVRKDPVTGKLERYFPYTTRVKRQLTSLVTISFMIGLVISAVVGIFIYRAILITAGGIYGPTVCALLNSIQIKVFNFIYDLIAVKLNAWENYRTEAEYEDALVVKLFAYQFINYYISLFYVAFFKDAIEGCDYGDCLGELSYNLWVMFAINVLFNVVELGLPILLKHMELRTEAKKVEQMIQARHSARMTAGYVEFQGKLDSVILLYEYLELVMNFGYICFFCVAFPLGPFIYWLCNILEVYVDGYKFTTLCRRPFPRRVDSIGNWRELLHALTIISMITNAGIMVTYAELFSNSWSMFVLIEHILIITVVMINQNVPAESEFTKTLIKRHKVLSDSNNTRDRPLVVPNQQAEYHVYFNDNEQESQVQGSQPLKMRYLAAFALAYISGKSSPSAADVKKILTAAGADIDDAKVDAIVNALAGKDIAEVVTEKLATLSAVPSGAGVAASSAGVAEVAKPAEVEAAAEEEEEEDDFGFDLFG